MKYLLACSPEMLNPLVDVLNFNHLKAVVHVKYQKKGFMYWVEFEMRKDLEAKK